MTSTAQMPDADLTAAQPVRMLDGGRLMLRGLQRLFGVAFIVVAFGLWLLPGSSFESEMLLFKLLLSIVAGFLGIGLLQSGAPQLAPHIEIDTIRREVRLVRASQLEAPQVLERCAFDDLAHVELEGPHVRLWDASGAFMAEVTLTDQKVFSRLTACLRDSGKVL